LCCLCFHSACSSAKEVPTAIIVDNDTGQPIEGAVALAQWIKLKPTLFEGGIPEVKKANETFSDKEGKIYIDGFWGTYIFSEKPTLTVYKQGYVVWNNERVCPNYTKRLDFDKDRRLIKLQKFDIYLEWQKKYSYIEYPHNNHAMFFRQCVDSAIGSHNFKINEVFENSEGEFERKELLEIDKKRKQ
jgi:hypothetical protein